MNDFGIVKNPKQLKVNKNLLPKNPKPSKFPKPPKYYRKKMKQIRKGLL